VTIDSWIAATLLKIDPTPFFQKYGENAWARVKGYLDACTDAAAALVIEKYRDVLAVADVFTASTTFWVMESNRLDLAMPRTFTHRGGNPMATTATVSTAIRDRFGGSRRGSEVLSVEDIGNMNERSST